MIKKRFVVAFVLQALFLFASLILDLPGSWSMFAKVERVDFSVSKHGRALDPMKYLPSSYVFVSQKRAVLYQRFICAKEGGGLQILDKITGTRVGCESF